MSHLIAWGLPKFHLDSIEMTGDWGHPTFVSGFLKCTEALISIQHVKICSTQKNHPITTVSGSKSPISFVFWNRACVSVWEMKEKFKLKIKNPVQPILYFKIYATDAHLCECDWPVFGDVLSIFACEHSAITSIHLLRNLLRIRKTNKNLEMILEIF